MQELTSGFASWRKLLASPPRAAHIAQWYDNDEFVGAAVAHFASEGLSRGEAVALRGTAQHLASICAHIGSNDVDVAAAMRRGQLAMSDADEAIAAITPNGSFDADLFERGANSLLEAMVGDGRFTGIRWWGEMSDLFFRRGDAVAAVQVEKVAEKVGLRHGLTMMCSILCDRFDACAYDGLMADVCRTHSHVVPAEDYAGHRLAVNRAIAEVVGDISGSLLQSLASWKGRKCDLPSSQAMLFWLREALPEKFHTVLSRARHYDAKEKAE
jgi:hypothetical protein